MTTDESYQMLQVLRQHLSLRVYENAKTYEIVLTFTTNDGKVHQVCNSFKENIDAINSN